jgi:hypothetical protein
MNFASNGDVMIFAESNYTTDSINSYLVQVNTANTSTYYKDSFSIRGVTIKNYNRINSKNYTTNVLMFDVLNNWNNGYVNWSISEPNIKNSTYLNNNESILVFIENNYTIQGNRQPEINVTTSTYVDRIREFFEIKPIKISNLLTLSENKSGSVSELIVKNNLNNTQSFTWKFDTGITNVTNGTYLNASESIFVYIASNYTTSKIYQTTALVNTTAYNDTENGVILA